jgi:hypothetical protein
MKRVFISGPYTIGDIAQNVKVSMDVANELIDAGYAPFCPHLTHFLHMNHFQPYKKWLEIDVAFLEVCDALIRIPGKSKGADAEVRLAKKFGIPIFKNVSELTMKLPGL